VARLDMLTGTRQDNGKGIRQIRQYREGCPTDRFFVTAARKTEAVGQNKLSRHDKPSNKQPVG
jgi:hypothetical protein